MQIIIFLEMREDINFYSAKNKADEKYGANGSHFI